MRPTIRLQWATRQIDAVDAEVAQEKAASLRRAYDRLERALAQLHRHDDRSRAAPSSSPPAKSRAELVADAAEALWYYVVQREACGLRDSEAVLRELDVPGEVRLRMGVRGRRKS
jgi:hypothetical protein